MSTAAATEPLYLCLSSGYSEQYKRDIIRALAMPTGSILQFRYQDEYIQEDVRRDFDSKEEFRRQVLIAYVDQSDPNSGSDPEMVPVRYATLRRTEAVGRFYILHLELTGLCSTQNIDTFNRSVRRLAVNLPPVWRAGKPFGSYCFEVRGPIESIGAGDLKAFEDTVKLLASHVNDYGGESLFYHILGIEQIPDETTLTPRHGDFVLKANETYSLRVLHFNPGSSDNAQLVFQSGTPSITITTNPVLSFTSRYDLKRLGLRVANPPPAQGELPTFDEESDSATARTASVLSVYRLAIGKKAEERDWEFDIPVRVRPDLAPVRAFGSLFGLVLAVPSLVSIAGSSALSSTAKYWLGGAAVLGSVVLGMLAALGLRRPTP